jgi:DNA-binding transcriptional ArsR family regulator
MSVESRPKDAVFEQFARVGKALGSPKRLELIDVLAQGERTVESLAQAAGLKITTASAHLQTLRHSGLVATRKDGTRIYYRLASEAVIEAFASVRAVAIKHLAETERAARTFLGEDGVEAVTRNDILRLARSGRYVLLDVRPLSAFHAGHIDGAVSIPLDELADRLSELPLGREVVAYCNGEYCVLSYDAVRLLRAKGVDARRLDGGMLEWRLERRPVAVGA